MTAERHELLERLAALRHHIHDEIGVAVLMAAPTKACCRLVAGLLDSLNNLEALVADDR
jgi:hypothetical protein